MRSHRCDSEGSRTPGRGWCKGEASPPAPSHPPETGCLAEPPWPSRTERGSAVADPSLAGRRWVAVTPIAGKGLQTSARERPVGSPALPSRAPTSSALPGCPSTRDPAASPEGPGKAGAALAPRQLPSSVLDLSPATFAVVYQQCWTSPLPFSLWFISSAGPLPCHFHCGLSAVPDLSPATSGCGLSTKPDLSPDTSGCRLPPPQVLSWNFCTAKFLLARVCR